MFGIGSTELLVILLVALIVLGPKSLAGVSRSLGRAMGEFRKVSTDFQRTLNAEAAREDLREKEQKRAVASQKTEQNAASAESAQQAGASFANAPKADPATADSGETGANTTKAAASPLDLAVARAQAEATQCADKTNRQNS